jgi:hypothetical protein
VANAQGQLLPPGGSSGFEGSRPSVFPVQIRAYDLRLTFDLQPFTNHKHGRSPALSACRLARFGAARINSLDAEVQSCTLQRGGFPLQPVISYDNFLAWSWGTAMPCDFIPV